MADYRVGKDVRGVSLRKPRPKAARADSTGTCVCPECGFVKTRIRGTPCDRLMCPNCSSRLAEKE